ncbi:hypothetical protein G5B47_02210 [Paenibacillus sp. 7124]|uniref:Uncharacterized protein n=1 Tax=Paenibacillus apii TaxID=1850370 RepID=A0A6M1PLL0_9BACL|nr:hypothetical protein [Paenibacillus apii]NGM81221.1 hypothetical protein [Paenibacillus apii]
MVKTTKYLRVHKDGADVTGGKRYEIVGESAKLYTIRDDAGDEHTWTKADTGKTFTLETDEITVLPDESLGAVMREYREVKRVANAGETVIMTEATGTRTESGREVPDYHNGDIFVIDHISGVLAASTSGKLFYHREYSVLLPTGVIVIDGDRFRMVDRKAAVGERVIIVAENDINGDGYGNGSLFKAVAGGTNEDGEGWTDTEDGVTLYDEEYRVLEPVTPAEPTQPLSAKPAEDQYAENIATLTLKVAELEKRVTTLEAALEAAQPAPKKLRAPITADVFPKTPQQQLRPSRDEIVERAKADVLDMRKFSGTKIPNDCIAFWPETKLPHAYIPMHTVWFEVNRAKRTVAAIIRCDDDGLITRGIAKCAPGETFNSHIGRAISLRRALGLEVPAEYLDAPRPEEPRVGDVVSGGIVYAVRPTHRTVGVERPEAFISSEKGYTYITAEGREVWEHLVFAKITDDSRENTQRKEAA